MSQQLIPPFSERTRRYFGNVATKANEIAEIIRYPMEEVGLQLLFRAVLELEAVHNPEGYAFGDPKRKYFPHDPDLARGLNLIRNALDEILTSWRIQECCKGGKTGPDQVFTNIASALAQGKTVSLPVLPDPLPASWRRNLRAGCELIVKRLYPEAGHLPPNRYGPDPNATLLTIREIATKCDCSVSKLRKSNLLSDRDREGKGNRGDTWWSNNPSVIKAIAELSPKTEVSPKRMDKKK